MNRPAGWAETELENEPVRRTPDEARRDH